MSDTEYGGPNIEDAASGQEGDGPAWPCPRCGQRFGPWSHTSPNGFPCHEAEHNPKTCQFGFVLNALRAHEYMTSLPPEKAAKLLGEDRGESIDRQAAAEWKRRAMHALAKVGELSTLLCDRDCQLAQDFDKLQRVRALMADPDPYRQDLGPDGTFNVPCVLVSDVKKALDDV